MYKSHWYSREGLRRFGRHLDFGQDGDDGDDNAEDEVEADEDLVLCAVIRQCVVHIEQYHGSKGQGIVHYGE